MATNHELLYLLTVGAGLSNSRRPRLHRFLVDASGNHQGTGNYTQSPREFTSGPQVGESWFVHQFVVFASAPNTYNAYPTSNYGTVGRLQNPWMLSVIDGTTTTTLYDQGIDSLGSFGAAGFELSETTAFNWYASNWIARFDFIGSTGAPLQLQAGEQLTLSLQDNFSSLEAHTFLITGWILEA